MSLFEAQVERTPEAIALQSRESRLTYRELNSRANQLAHYLRQLGVGSEKLVGICVERSLEMVIGLLGIFKAGGDLCAIGSHVSKRAPAFMLEDAQVSVCADARTKLIEDRGWRPVLSRIDSAEEIEDGEFLHSQFSILD